MLSTFIRRNKPKAEMTFLEHLDDLRVSMLRVLGVFSVGMVAALIFYEETPALLNMPLEWAKHPETSPIGFLLGQSSEGLRAIPELKEFTFMGVWKVLMYAAFGVGIALASPVFLYETARFVGPALTEREKRVLVPFCFAALVLFLMGSTLAFFWLSPMSVQIWHHFASGLKMDVIWQASDYYGFVIMMCLLTGLTFQFPLALIVVMWLEIVRPRTLLRHWRGMLFGIMCLVALITPIAEPISLFVMTGVLFGFYLVAVAIGTGIVRRKRVARGDSADPEDDDLDDDDGPDDDDDPDGDSPRRPASSAAAPAASPAAPGRPKQLPPPAEGDLSSLD
ncbi:MAG: twin-arginine translocase subunit TatC [Opitutales bacterium]